MFICVIKLSELPKKEINKRIKPKVIASTYTFLSIELLLLRRLFLLSIVNVVRISGTVLVQ